MMHNRKAGLSKKVNLAGIVRLAVVTTVMVWAACALTAQQIDSAELKYQDLLESSDPAQTCRVILSSANADEAESEIEALGTILALSRDDATAVLDCLAGDQSIEATTLQAELLLWIARGDETPRWKRKERKVQPVLMPTDELGRRAAAFLDHDDPFVRGFAEWAIAVRIGIENSGRTSISPEDPAPAWYERWKGALTPGFLLDCDYVRQGAVLGVHRSSTRLLESADQVLLRVEGATAEIREHGTAEQREQLRQDLQHLTKVYQHVVALASEASGDVTAQRKAWVQLRHAARRIVLTNPDIDFNEVLFATRHAYHDGPNITAGAKSYIIKPGGDIFVKAGLSPGDPLRPLIAGKLPPGHMRSMEMDWDGQRVVFAYARQPRYYDEVLVESDQGFDDKEHGMSEPIHIYEVGTDGTGLRQVTDHPFNSDAEPTYLPNGDIAFVSDRSNFGSQCSGSFLQNKRIVNLYRISRDGTNLRALSNNKDFDRYPRVLDNGQLIFTRWEYQERHLWQTHNLWTARPDGSMSDAIYKQHINSGPMALRDARQVSGSHKLVAIACGHHEYAQGAVTIIDHHKGLNDPEGMRIVTPRISPREGGIGRGKTVEQGGVIDRGGLYQQPFALSEQSFLVSYSYHLPRSDPNANNFAVYLIDVWGSKELIHREPVLSSVYPMPFRKRPRPPVIPDAVQPEASYAACYVTDVYSNVPEIERGTIKYIRIAQRTHWPTIQTGERVTDFNHLHYTPSGSWSRTLGVWTWTPARVIGTVPVEDDGSVHFKAPAGFPIYFQALDKNHMEVRRMRSFITLQPGEVRGCTGCHETKTQTPVLPFRVPLGVRKGPATPIPPPWGDTELPDYERHIQPIITRHCTACHGERAPDGGLEFTARKVDGYCQSYRTMFGLSADDPTPVDDVGSYKLFHPDQLEPERDREPLKKMERNEYPGQLLSISDRFSDASITEPMEFGSHKSKLILTLLNDSLHNQEVKMREEDWISLVTWIDLNAPYWGTFVDKQPVRKGERPRRVRIDLPSPWSSLAEGMPHDEERAFMDGTSATLLTTER